MSISKSSSLLYKRSWALFKICVEESKNSIVSLNDLPLTSKQVVYFISFLNLKGYAATSILSYTSAIGFIHKILDLPDPTHNFLVQKVLAGINKKFGRYDSRLPITMIILHRLCESLPKTNNIRYHRVLLKAMYLLAFYGLFRIGEITIQCDGSISLEAKDIVLGKDSLTIFITNYKHNTSQQPFKIQLNSQVNPEFCPVQAMKEYMSLRGFKQGPLFCFPDFKPIPRAFFVSRLKHSLNFCGLDPKYYQSHSFRIGSASFLSSNGFSDKKIQKLGRWKTMAFVTYIRGQLYKLKIK